MKIKILFLALLFIVPQYAFSACPITDINACVIGTNKCNTSQSGLYITPTSWLLTPGDSCCCYYKCQDNASFNGTNCQCDTKFYANGTTCAACTAPYTDGSDGGMDAATDCYKNCSTTINANGGNGTWYNDNSSNKAYSASSCTYDLSCSSGYTPSCNTSGTNTTCANDKPESDLSFNCINEKPCTAVGAAVAKTHWNDLTGWGTCTIESCLTNYYHDTVNNECKNTRPCATDDSISPSATSGGETYSGTSTSGYWDLSDCEMQCDTYFTAPTYSDISGTAKHNTLLANGWNYSTCKQTTNISKPNSTGTQKCNWDGSAFNTNCVYTVSVCNPGYYLANPGDADCTAVGIGYYSTANDDDSNSGTVDGIDRGKCPKASTTENTTSSNKIECKYIGGNGGTKFCDSKGCFYLPSNVKIPYTTN